MIILPVDFEYKAHFQSHHFITYCCKRRSLSELQWRTFISKMFPQTGTDLRELPRRPALKLCYAWLGKTCQQLCSHSAVKTQSPYHYCIFKINIKCCQTVLIYAMVLHNSCRSQYLRCCRVWIPLKKKHVNIDKSLLLCNYGHIDCISRETKLRWLKSTSSHH